MRKQLIKKTTIIALIFMLLSPHFVFTIASNNNDDISIVQEVEKCVDLGENQVLLQQKVNVKLNKEDAEKETERVTILVPTMQGQKPEIKGILVNGDRLEKEKFGYDSNSGLLTINIQNANVLGKTETEYKVIYKYSNVTIEASEILLSTSAVVMVKDTGELQKEDSQTVSLEMITGKIQISN